MTPRNTVLVGDVRKTLGGIAPDSVDCVVTSPPYFRLRNYQVDGQIGHEDTVNAWVDELVKVADGLAEVLRPEGTFWLNLGDAYSRHVRLGGPPKSLLLGPERLALALTQRGWVLRNKIVWAKTNPQPSSVADRLSATWESVYLFAQNKDYWFDLDAVRVPHRSRRTRKSSLKPPTAPPAWAGPLAGSNSGLSRLKAVGQPGHRLGKNPGDVWSHATAGYRGAHFAVFPESLIERPIRAGCPERVCETCGRAGDATVTSPTIRGSSNPSAPAVLPGGEDWSSIHSSAPGQSVWWPSGSIATGWASSSIQSSLGWPASALVRCNGRTMPTRRCEKRSGVPHDANHNTNR